MLLTVLGTYELILVLTAQANTGLLMRAAMITLSFNLWMPLKRARTKTDISLK